MHKHKKNMQITLCEVQYYVIEYHAIHIEKYKPKLRNDIEINWYTNHNISIHTFCIVILV